MTFEEYTSWRLPAVLRFAAVLTGDSALAEDVVQDVLIRAHRHWGKIGRLDQPDPYIRRMVVNEFIATRRRSWRLVPSGDGADVDDRVAPDHAGDHAERTMRAGELRAVPRHQGRALAAQRSVSHQHVPTGSLWSAVVDRDPVKR